MNDRLPLTTRRKGQFPVVADRQDNHVDATDADLPARLAALDEKQFATPGDAALVIRLLSPHSEKTIALNGGELSRELQTIGCAITRAGGHPTRSVAWEFQRLLHAAAHRRGLPQRPRAGLEKLLDPELVAEAARRACMVTDAPKVPALRFQLDQALEDWDQTLDEWIVRLFAQLRTVVWNRAGACTPSFPAYLWFETDPRTSQGRPTGEHIANGELSWGAAVARLTLVQLEELATTRALDFKPANSCPDTPVGPDPRLAAAEVTPSVQTPPPRLLPDPEIHVTHRVADIAPPYQAPESPLTDEFPSASPRNVPRDRTRVAGSKTRANPSWRACMAKAAPLVCTRGLSLMIAIHELAGEGKVDPRWDNKSERSYRDYWRWWKEERPPVS